MRGFFKDLLQISKSCFETAVTITIPLILLRALEIIKWSLVWVVCPLWIAFILVFVLGIIIYLTERGE